MRILFLAFFILGGSTTAPTALDGKGTTVRGIVSATEAAEISTDLFLMIDELPFREGQVFAAGDLLIAFDCADLKADLKAAEAGLAAEALVYKNNARLAKMNAIGDFEVALQKAKVDHAAAKVDGLAGRATRCAIEAPFAGRVAEMNVRPHEFPDRQRPLMQIVGLSAPEIELLLPAVWLRWLRPGTKFEMIIEELGHRLGARIVHISSVVDPVSQTVKAVGNFVDQPKGLLPGMSGPALFAQPSD